MSPADVVIYRAFMRAPYNGFQADRSIRHAARVCGVSVARVHESIGRRNPGCPWYPAASERSDREHPGR